MIGDSSDLVLKTMIYPSYEFVNVFYPQVINNSLLTIRFWIEFSELKTLGKNRNLQKVTWNNASSSLKNMTPDGVCQCNDTNLIPGAINDW
jgi:hypothetical protein